jgi:hypothetical protein
VRAAAWCGRDGTIRVVREDVGRHNALDKSIGGLLHEGSDRAEGFVLSSSCCSFEMVTKAAAFGAGTLVSVSAPTSKRVEEIDDLVATRQRFDFTLLMLRLADRSPHSKSQALIGARDRYRRQSVSFGSPQRERRGRRCWWRQNAPPK